ncbi:MAG: hypothetical protein ABSE64_05755 [Vulcanimicrobiaceae bacterium]|jgi:hypothetical protein
MPNGGGWQFLGFMTKSLWVPEILALLLLLSGAIIFAHTIGLLPPTFNEGFDALGLSQGSAVNPFVVVSGIIYLFITLVMVLTATFFKYTAKAFAPEDRMRGVALTRQMLSWIKVWIAAFGLVSTLPIVLGAADSMLNVVMGFGMLWTIGSFSGRIQRIGQSGGLK